MNEVSSVIDHYANSGLSSIVLTFSAFEAMETASTSFPPAFQLARGGMQSFLSSPSINPSPDTFQSFQRLEVDVLKHSTLIPDC